MPRSIGLCHRRTKENSGVPKSNSSASTRNNRNNSELPPIENDTEIEEEVAQQPNLSVSKSQSSRRTNKRPTSILPVSPEADSESIELESRAETKSSEVNSAPPSVARKPAPGAKSNSNPVGTTNGSSQSVKNEGFRLDGSANSGSPSPGARNPNALSAPSPSASNAMIQMGYRTSNWLSMEPPPFASMSFVPMSSWRPIEIRFN